MVKLLFWVIAAFKENFHGNTILKKFTTFRKQTSSGETTDPKTQLIKNVMCSHCQKPIRYNAMLDLHVGYEHRDCIPIVTWCKKHFMVPISVY